MGRDGMKRADLQPPSGRVGAVALALAGLLAACGSPLRDDSTARLRRSVMDAAERELIESGPGAGERVAARVSGVGELGITERHLEEIERDYNPVRYYLGSEGSVADDPTLALDQVRGLAGEDLMGREPRIIAIGLREAIRSAVERNLALQEARFAPAINESDVVAAQAAFDWVLFNDFAWTDVDTPQPGPGFLAFGDFSVNEEQQVRNETRLSRALRTGGVFQVSQELIYTDTRASGFGPVGVPNPSAAANYRVDLTQPLLEGFGSAVALAEVRLAQNAERSAVSGLKASLMDVVTQTETAYWNLVLAQRQLVINSRLLERGVKVRDDVRARRALDAVQAQVADAVATVESRKGDIISAQRDLRRASDALKLQINDPRIPVGSEVLLVPVDIPLDEPIGYSLVEGIRSALTQRPELEQALLAIDDASIRETVARNARLPALDLAASATLRGFGASVADALDNAPEGEFFDDFSLGFQFEQPIGNRAAEAGFRRGRLERLQSVVTYRRLAQSIVLEVKDALDDVLTSYRLIEQARTSRIAEAEALRTLIVEKELTERGFTVERLDVELGQQAALAAAETAEIAALIDYNVAIAALHRAIGSALDRNRIRFVVPDANQLSIEDSSVAYRIEPEPNPPGSGQ